MAVCGRCLICGYKFNGRMDDGTAPDEAVRWACSRGDRCSRATARDLDELGEAHEHALCVTCHDHLVDDDTIAAVAQALLAMVRDRVKVDGAQTFDLALARQVAANTKHGPGGTGARGPCDPGCMKCGAEAAIARHTGRPRSSGRGRPMTFFKGSDARLGDTVRVQRGEHAGKAGTVRERVGDRLLVAPWPRASWTEFWIDAADVAVDRP